MPKLEKVQETLVIPLWGRAKISKGPSPILSDEKAVEIVEKLEYDFSRINKRFDMFKAFCWACRAKILDDEIRLFLKVHPRAIVVNLGAGLETAFHRVDNNQLRWYDLDLPEVIEIRRKLIPETDRSKCIARSLFDFQWFEEIEKGDDLLLISSGVLAYFPEQEVKGFFLAVADRFPGAEIVFDACSRLGLIAGNRALRKSGIRDALHKWPVGDARSIAKWDPRIEVVSQYPFFKHVRREKGWGIEVLIKIWLYDVLRISRIFHLRFRKV